MTMYGLFPELFVYIQDYDEESKFLSYNIPICNIPASTNLPSAVATPSFNRRECHLHVEMTQIFFSVCESAKFSEAQI